MKLIFERSRARPQMRPAAPLRRARVRDAPGACAALRRPACPS